MEEEFDETFQRLLVKVVMDGRLPSMSQPASCSSGGGERRRRLAEQEAVIMSKPVRPFIYGINRAVLKWLFEFHRMNLLHEFKPNQDRRSSLGQRLRRLFREARERRQNTKFHNDRNWPLILLAMIIISSIVLLINVYYQYIYDTSLLRLAKLRSHLNNSDGRHLLVDKLHLNVKALEEKLEANIRAAHWALKTIGAPHLEWTLMIEVAVLFFLNPVILYIILMPLLYYTSDMVLLAPRLVIDPNDECRVRARLIICELNRFLASSLLFATARLDRTCKDLVLEAADDYSGFGGGGFGGDRLVHDLFEIRLGCMIRDRVMINVANRFSRQHRLTVDRLKRIALEGRLNQMNRTPASRDKMELLFFISMLIVSFYFSVFIIGGYIIVDIYLNTKGIYVRFESVQDVLFALMLALILFTCLMNALFVFLINFITLADQLSSISCLRELILEQIKRNEYRLNQMLAVTSNGTHELQQQQQQAIKTASKIATTTSTRRCDARRIIPQSQSQQPKPSAKSTSARRLTRVVVGGETRRHIKYEKEFAELLELDLLTVILQCRLSARTFNIARQQVSQAAFLIIYVVVSVSVVMRIHSAYYFPELKTLCIYIGMVCAGTGFLFLIPLSVMHQQMIHTFKTVWSLVAQLSLFESIPQINESFESSIAILTIRREIADSTMSKFACKLILMPITYGNLIRIAFWVCLVMIPLMDGNLMTGSSTSFINDPFGLYNFS